MNPVTHRFQPMLDMDDLWFLVDTESGRRTAETFPHDAAILFCWNLDDEPSRASSFAWADWPQARTGLD